MEQVLAGKPITEENIEEQLRAAERRFRTLVEQIPAMVYSEEFEVGYPQIEITEEGQKDPLLAGLAPRQRITRPLRLRGGGTKDFAPYVLMILVLMIRPYGIFGEQRIERV